MFVVRSIQEHRDIVAIVDAIGVVPQVIKNGGIIKFVRAEPIQQFKVKNFTTKMSVVPSRLVDYERNILFVNYQAPVGRRDIGPVEIYLTLRTHLAKIRAGS